jgi:hypothetical protein
MHHNDIRHILSQEDASQVKQVLPEMNVAGSEMTGRPAVRSAAPAPVLLKLTPHQARDMPRWIPHLIHYVRRRLLQQPENASPTVAIDLSAIPPTPACAPLLLLFRLVRRLLGTTSQVIVTGVNVALCTCLVADLPAGVTVVDQRGRRWSA